MEWVEVVGGVDVLLGVYACEQYCWRLVTRLRRVKESADSGPFSSIEQYIFCRIQLHSPELSCPRRQR